MRAVLERPERVGDPIALTVNFCAPSRGEFTVATKVARTNRSSQHWQATPPLPTLTALTWVAQYELRFAEGLSERSETTFDPPRSPRSVLWLRDAEPRPLDFVSLAALSDAFFGRIFQVIGRIPPFGTVSMTTYFHASADELAAHGTAPLAAVADARIFHRSFGDQTAELFGANGQLLATAVQVAFF